MKPMDKLAAAIWEADRRCFVKSMTTHIDPRLWQGVYHAETPAGTAYVKFTLRTDGSIVASFKRLRA